MSKIKAKFPIDSISGILGHIDRTIGIEGGLSVRLSSQKKGVALGIKTKATTTRSAGQTARTEVYCGCDAQYRTISAEKKYFLGIYWAKVMHNLLVNKTNFMVWMSICMRSAPYKTLFINHSFVTRYKITNNTAETWTNVRIKLKSVTVKTASGKDVMAVYINTKYEYISTASHTVYAAGQIIICLPSLLPQRSLFIDVYSYNDSETPGECV